MQGVTTVFTTVKRHKIGHSGEEGCGRTGEQPDCSEGAGWAAQRPRQREKAGKAQKAVDRSRIAALRRVGRSWAAIGQELGVVGERAPCAGRLGITRMRLWILSAVVVVV